MSSPADNTDRFPCGWTSVALAGISLAMVALALVASLAQEHEHD